MVGSVTPRSPFSALNGERLPGPGHNQGPPLDAAISWRLHAWKKARKDLLPRLPLEVVRRRVRRATELGLEYPQYASILLGTGRDIVGFLFTCEALGLRLERSARCPEPVSAKLATLNRCERILGVETVTDPANLIGRIASAGGPALEGVTSLPGRSASWSVSRRSLVEALAPLKLPADGVVMIGTAAHERSWADAARLAKFLPADAYFGLRC